VINDYLESGLALVPVPLGEKGPSEKGWNLRQNVVMPGNDVARLENHNVGLAHAYCEPTPTCAIDIDNYKLSILRLANQDIDLKAMLRAPDAVVIWSGKYNSLKLLYRLPLEVGVLVSKQLKCDDGSMMLEFRCASKSGKTTQDLLPPSRHPRGSKYSWVGKGNPTQIPVIPTQLLVIWQNLNEGDMGNRRATARTTPYGRQPTPREVASIKAKLCCIDADCDYFQWRDVVWALLSTGWSCAAGLALDWSKTAQGRFDSNAFETLVDSYDPDCEHCHTLGTLVHHAKLGGWNE
jgi:putative DNA primase/helicase